MDELPPASKGTFLAIVPAGITDSGALFNAFDKIFDFPYFGFNWNALNDCFGGFEWITVDEPVSSLYESL